MQRKSFQMNVYFQRVGINRDSAAGNHRFISLLSTQKVSIKVRFQELVAGNNRQEVREKGTKGE